MDNFRHIVEIIARIVEGIGIAVIIIGVIYSVCGFLIKQGQKNENAYRDMRHQLGKAILLGLEILVAADIVATVVTEPTMEKVLILGVIVLIRTFLSFSIQIELEGRFPWQKKTQPLDRDMMDEN